MNLRTITTTALVFLALSLSSCGTVRRAGKDAFVTIASPILIPYGAATDSVADSHNVKEGLGGSAGTEVISTVVSFPFNVIKHAFYTVVHACDFVLFPVYGIAELHPYGPEIEPLDFYTGTWLDKKEKSADAGTDAESGEDR